MSANKTVKVVIDTRKTLEQNAAAYFERAKKAKKKLEGAKKAIGIAQSKLGAMNDEQKLKELAQKQKPVKVVRKQEWYEKLRWFVSSDGFLCIGGRDATTNEIVVKKHTLKGDMVCHTDMAGAPFVVIKAEGKEIPMTTLEEAAQFCACYCRAWKLGIASVEVFYVSPEQLSKEANSGEFLPKGAFMVRGTVKYLQVPLNLAIGKMEDGRVIAGHPRSVLKHSQNAIAYSVLQGSEKASDVAKPLVSLLKAELDDIISVLPAGGVKLGKQISTRVF